MKILELSDVWKAYDEVQALKGLNLEIQRGEMFGLVGPNGAGKTTALKIIVGLLRMDRGSVKVDGLDITAEPYKYKGLIGYVPESVTLPDYLTVEELLIYSGKIRKVSQEVLRERIDFYLNVFNLQEKRRTLILLLSRGMKQKAAMASALIHDPELLILDEPLIGIDPAGQHETKQLFNTRIKEDKTVFISTHMLDTAERMCDRVAVINKGRNIASGNLENLQELSKTAKHATLEDVFLKLTEEAEEKTEATVEPPKKNGRGLSSFFRRKS